MRIIFFGTPDFVLPIVKSIADQFDLVGVVTLPDSPVGRKKIMTPSPLKSWYMKHILEKNKEGVILTPNELTEDTAVKLRKLHPDLFVVAAYGKLIPKQILSIPTSGSLNIHPSTLPEFRGPSPIQYAILDGKGNLGITLMQMDEELDHGPILTQWEIPITDRDTFESLHVKAFKDAAEKLPSIIEDYINKTLTPDEQDHLKATFTEKIEKQDGYFDIENPPSPEQLNRMIRAYYPWPTAWSKLQMANGKLQIVKFLPENMIQLEGGKPMKIKDFLNGYPEVRQLLERLLQKV